METKDNTNLDSTDLVETNSESSETKSKITTKKSKKVIFIFAIVLILVGIISTLLFSNTKKNNPIIGKWNTIQVWIEGEKYTRETLENAGYTIAMDLIVRENLSYTASSSDALVSGVVEVYESEEGTLYTFKEAGGKAIINTENPNELIFDASEIGDLTFVLSRDGATNTTADIPQTNTDINTSTATTGEKNALKKAKQYLDYSAFSYKGLIEQLEYEGFTNAESVYAVDNCGADWNQQAVLKAEQYLEYSSFSRSGLIEQLEYEGFTSSQAEYAVNQVY